MINRRSIFALPLLPLAPWRQESFLKPGHRQADPCLLTKDDLLRSPNLVLQEWALYLREKNARA